MTACNDPTYLHVSERLKGSKYGKDAHIRRMMKEFEKSVKPRFTNVPKRAYYFPTGLMDNNVGLGIKNGSLALTQSVAVPFLVLYHH